MEDALRGQGLTIFSSQEFRRATGFSPASAKQLLIRYVQKGLILQLKRKRGLYCLKGRPPHPWLLANRLLRPSYVSLETALAHYGIIPEAAYAVTSVTPKVTRVFEAMNLSFHFHKIKKEAYTGYRPLDIEGETVLAAEPEKAVADFLYLVRLGKKAPNDRMRLERVKKAKVLSYLRLFGKGLVEWAKHAL
jgi:predicted transcriptional regulator of viral defense system